MVEIGIVSVCGNTMCYLKQGTYTTSTDIHNTFRYFYPNAHKMVLYQGLFFCWAENLKFLIFKEQFVLS